MPGEPKKLVYKFDNQGRKTEVRETNATGNLRASWTYDPNGAKGHPATITRHDSGLAYTTTINKYDHDYQVEEATYDIPGFGAGGGLLSYKVKSSYTANGQPANQELPAVGGVDGEIITYGYNSVGKPASMTNNAGQSYVASTEYHYDGLIYRQYLGNPGKQVRLSTDFDTATRRLTRIWNSVESQTQAGSFYVPYDYAYGYDNAGNIKSVAGSVHGVADQEECFTYDHLRRMTEAWTQTSGACTTPQRAGADPYHRQWTVDKSGNRTAQKDFDTTNTDWTYTVGAADSCGGTAKPHTVASITATGPKAGTPTRTFCYDAAGNLTKRTTDTGTVQDLTWDFEGHLAAVTQGTSTWSYLYDVDGNRLIGKTPSGETLYLPDGTEVKKLAGGQIVATRYYGHNGKTIAVRVGATLTWVAADHNGTQQTQVAAANVAYQRNRSMPYGEARGGQTSIVGTKGYVGGTKDDTGLTHLGAREYDPTTARFASIDPEINHQDPQSLHGYLYANNSPITFTDPTGRSWGWFAVAVVAIIVVAVVVAIVFPAAIPALIAAGSAAMEAGAGAAAMGAGASGVALAAGGAAAAELTVATGMVATGAAATTLLTAGVAGRAYFGGSPEGPTVGGGVPTPKTPATGADLLKPGPWANRSIPATSAGASAEERRIINLYYKEDGCHSCGTKLPENMTPKGNAVPDHQPATSAVAPGTPQQLNPHCHPCSNAQGLYLLKNRNERYPHNQAKRKDFDV